MTTIPMLQKELDQAYKDIKYYKNRIERLNNQLQQKENIIKEVREEIIKYKEILEIGAEQNVFYIYLDSPIQKLEELLEILDKAGDSNERNKDNK